MAITPDTQRMVAYQANGENGAIRGFRNPSKFDVLSGRGGSVNAHAGNVYFREIVQQRKVEYNLESNKERKAIICREVIAQVAEKGGTFLVKENNNTGTLWTVLSDERTMAKVSQALREGAPRMREAIRGTKPDARSKRALRNHTDTTRNHNKKRVRVEYRGQQVLPNDASPQMTSSPLVPTSTPLPAMALSGSIIAESNANTNLIPNPKPLQRTASSISLTGINHDSLDDNEQFIHPFTTDMMPPLLQKPVQRAHSLVLSDISPHPNYLEDDFVDPFDGDDTEWRASFHRQNSDMAGLGALLSNEAAEQ